MDGARESEAKRQRRADVGREHGCPPTCHQCQDGRPLARGRRSSPNDQEDDGGVEGVNCEEKEDKKHLLHSKSDNSENESSTLNERRHQQHQQFVLHIPRDIKLWTKNN